MNIAVILAGGSGSRIGSDTPKQFIEVNGKKVIEYSIEAFEHHPLIDEILIVCKSGYIDQLNNLVKKNRYQKVVNVIAGGKERYQSSICAMNACENDNDILLFHDAARPLISKRIIDDCLEAMTRYDAVTVAVDTTDTIYISDQTGHIVDIPMRKTLKNAQTPQCFRRFVIHKAYLKALQDTAFMPTDDCSVVHKYLPDTRIHMVMGDTTNIKITYPEDIDFFKKLLNQNS